MTERLRIVIVGAGRITQSVHLPLLLSERDLFEVVGIADPSNSARTAVADRFRDSVRVFESIDDLFNVSADACLCATPVPMHAPVVVAALGQGMHVLCEKPAAYTPQDHDSMIRSREATDRVVQIGYMKRYELAYRALCERVRSAEIIAIRSAVVDPHAEPFLEHPLAPQDAAVTDEVQALERLQLSETTGSSGAYGFRAYRHGYLGSLIHQVNLMHGLLEARGESVPATVIAGDYWAKGSAVALTCEVAQTARASLTHIALRGVADYRETLEVLCADRTFEVSFSSPYLPRRPAQLIERRTTDGRGLSVTTLRPPATSAFRRQLIDFHNAAVGRVACTNTAEAARADLSVIQKAFALAVKTHANFEPCESHEPLRGQPPPPLI
jgi:predicted dehydrogenase